MRHRSSSCLASLCLSHFRFPSEGEVSSNRDRYVAHGLDETRGTEVAQYGEMDQVGLRGLPLGVGAIRVNHMGSCIGERECVCVNNRRGLKLDCALHAWTWNGLTLLVHRAPTTLRHKANHTAR